MKIPIRSWGYLQRLTGGIREASCYLDERVPQVYIILEKHQEPRVEVERGWPLPYTQRSVFSPGVGNSHRTSRELLVRVTVAIGSFQIVRLW